VVQQMAARQQQEQRQQAVMQVAARLVKQLVLLLALWRAQGLQWQWVMVCDTQLPLATVNGGSN
jgi:hypothetical protein